MKYILIKKSESTTELEGLSDLNVEMMCLSIGSENEASAMAALDEVNTDYWMSSDRCETKEGDTTDSILLPKKAINA